MMGWASQYFPNHIILNVTILYLLDWYKLNIDVDMICLNFQDSVQQVCTTTRRLVHAHFVLQESISQKWGKGPASAARISLH